MFEQLSACQTTLDSDTGQQQKTAETEALKNEKLYIRLTFLKQISLNSSSTKRKEKRYYCDFLSLTNLLSQQPNGI